MSLPPFPETASQFYALRDNRTSTYDAMATGYWERRVFVDVTPGVASSFAGQVMLVVSANLLARWCRDVSMRVPDVPLCVGWGRAGGLHKEVIDTMRDADPFGQFEFVHDAPDKGIDILLALGTEPLNAVATTVIASAGWFAAVRRGRIADMPPGGLDHPVGAAAAAVLGGAQLFRDAVGMGQLYPLDFCYDAFSARPAQPVLREIDSRFEPADLGAALMVGAGSVGSAAAYFMDLFATRAMMDVADADTVKVENFGRSPLFGRNTYAAPKPRGIAAAIRGSSLEIAPLDGWWHEQADTSLSRYDVLLPVANEHDIRWQLQNSYPPLMVHASTGRNWNVNFGRHVPGRDDCLADRFEGFRAAELLRCSEGEVPMPTGATVDAALPFLSFWAGLLLAADLVRLGVAGYPHTPNFGNYSFRKNRFVPQLSDQVAATGCICRSQSKGFWRFHGRSRYAEFSPGDWR
jgi:hypothetical protein